MVKFIVVRCRDTYYRIYEDMTKVAQARFKKRRPVIPQFGLPPQHMKHNDS